MLKDSDVYVALNIPFGHFLALLFPSLQIARCWHNCAREMTTKKLTWNKVDDSTIQVDCPTCGQKHNFPADEDTFTGKKGINVFCINVDRRYRLFQFYVDTRRNIINHPVQGIDPIRDNVRNGVLDELGPVNFEEKFQR